MEQVIVVAVLGIMAAITVPNVMAMLNRMKVEQAMNEVRNALDETQREAVRSNKICSVTLNFVDGEISGPCLMSGRRKLPSEVDIATNLIRDAASADVDETSPVVREPIPLNASSVVATDVSLDFGLSDQRVTQIAMLPLSDQAPEAPQSAMLIQIIGDAGGRCKSKGKGIKHCREIPVQFGVLGNPKFAIATPSDTSMPADPSGKIVLYLPTHQSTAKKCIALSQSLGLTRIGNYEGPLTPSDITTQGTCTASNWKKQ